MKNIGYKFFFLALTVFLTMSCQRDEDVFLASETSRPAAPRLEVEQSFFDFDVISGGTDASISFNINIGQGTPPKSLRLYKTFVSADPDPDIDTLKTSTGDARVLLGEYTSFPQTVSFGIQDIISGYENFTFGDLLGGDYVTIEIEYTMANDVVVEPLENEAVDLVYNFFVSCATDPASITGNYVSEMLDSNFGPSVGTTRDVVVTYVGTPEPFRYNVSDHTVGLYIPFGGSDYPADFFDVCTTTILQPTRSFGAVTDFSSDLGITTSIDVAAGQFALAWFEANNGLFGVVGFTKQ